MQSATQEICSSCSEEIKSPCDKNNNFASACSNNRGPRACYVIHPDWVSEGIVPYTTVFSVRRPWPWEMPAYRACVDIHPPDVCTDKTCYCKVVVCPIECGISGEDWANVTGADNDKRREMWERELAEIKAYNCIPEPVSRAECLRNATIQKNWLWETYTHAVCTPSEGLVHDMQEHNYLNPGLMDLRSIAVKQ